MYTLINGSQKIKDSNSLSFLKYIANEIGECKIYNLKDKKYKEIINNIYKSSAVVIAFPLYFDSPNSLTLSFLDYIYDNKIYLNKPIYIIINCGFREGKHNITALNIIKNCCLKTNITYNGSLLIGAGEIAGNKKYKIISKKIYNNLDKLSNCIKNNQRYKDTITTISLLNNKLYCMIANYSWNKKSKNNNLNINEIRKK